MNIKFEPSEFNSANADYAPSMYENGKIVISSDRTNSTGEEVYAWTGRRFTDLYLVENNKADNFDKGIKYQF